MNFDERTYINAGVAFVLACKAQAELREWVREVEDDVLFHDPGAMR